MKKFRVGILGIFHESNTFYPSKTTFESFKGGRGFQTGEEIRASYRGGLHQVSGFFEVLESEGIEPVPLFLTGAGPTGIIEKGTLQKLWGLAEERLTAAGPLDGILAAPHGAAAAEDHADADGWWLTKLREAVGPGKPIIATLDPHVNLSQKMIRACNAFVAFKQNPHIDQKETGIEAARLMARTLRGEIRPVQAATLPPIAINIERQLTFEGPCHEIQQQLNMIRAVPGVLSASLALGYQYADVKKMGSGFIVVTDNQPILARALAQAMATHLMVNREKFVGNLISIPQALEFAARNPKPVCLLDMGDNIGGGGPGDSTFLTRAAMDRGMNALACLYDSESESQARKAGVGSRLTLRMGGKSDLNHGEPVEAQVTVISLHDGRFQDDEPRHGGQRNYNMGPTAVVKTDGGLTVMLTGKRIMPSSIHQLLSCNLRPESFDVILVKGVHAPYAAYQPYCPTVIRVNTPGVTSADFSQFRYKHRRSPLFPFEPIPDAAMLTKTNQKAPHPNPLLKE